MQPDQQSDHQPDIRIPFATALRAILATPICLALLWIVAPAPVALAYTTVAATVAFVWLACIAIPCIVDTILYMDNTEARELALTVLWLALMCGAGVAMVWGLVALGGASV